MKRRGRAKIRDDNEEGKKRTDSRVADVVAKLCTTLTRVSVGLVRLEGEKR